MLQDHNRGLIHSNLEKLLGHKDLSKSTVERWAAKFRRADAEDESGHGGDQSDRGIRQ